MSDVLLGQSYYLRFDAKLSAAMQPYPPLGTLYAAAYLRERGYDVALFDAMLADSEADWAAALDTARPRFAVLFEDNFNYLSKMCLSRMREAAIAMIRLARAKGCTVIAGGADATDHADLYLAEGAHYVLIGEGEYTLGELLDRLVGRTSTPFESIAGLAFRDKDLDEMGHDDATAARVVTTPRRPDITDLDRLPLPAWDLVDIPKYRSIWQRRHGYYSMNMVTSRGCPFHCAWCAKPIWGQHYAVRSPESVVNELTWLKEHYGPDHIWFADDILGITPGWVQRFAELVEARNVRIPFKSLHRVDLLLQGDTIRALKRAGAHTIWVGAESGSQQILDAMDKGTRVEQMHEVARRLHAAGIEVGFFLQFGYPGEGRAEIDQTLKMVRDCRPDDIGISVSYPLPGTRFFEAVKERLDTKRNWVESSDLDPMYEGPFSSSFYRKLHTVVHKEFRIRRAGEALRQVAGHPLTLRRRHLRQLAALIYHVGTLPVDRLQLERLARSQAPALARPSPTVPSEASAQSISTPE